MVVILALVLILSSSWLLLPHGSTQQADSLGVLVWLTFVCLCIGNLAVIIWQTSDSFAEAEEEDDENTED